MVIKEYEPLVVSRVPAVLEPDKLYISFDCNVIIHLCACGCGEKVVLPLTPNEWKIIYDGETVTISPSIGNFQYKCGSHYFIKHNRVVWADPMPPSPALTPVCPQQSEKELSLWQRFKNRIRRLF